jgi:hypothetical protein
LKSIYADANDLEDLRENYYQILRRLTLIEENQTQTIHSLNFIAQEMKQLRTIYSTFEPFLEDNPYKKQKI